MSFPTLHHDHDHCIRNALDVAEEHCRRRGARLTDIRRRVLELVWGSHSPVGAYALLDALAREGRSAAPPTVYRALDFLLHHGLVHRIALQNAFVGCAHPDRPHAAAFLLCSDCGTAAELDETPLADVIRAAAAAQGFTVVRQTIEVEGLCPRCRADQAPS